MIPTRPLSRRLVLTGGLTGGLLAGLAVTAPLLAIAEPADRAGTHRASSVSAIAAHSYVAPVVLATRPAQRASRAARPALAPRAVVRTVAVGRTFHGLASWYGGRFDGRQTANGERFDADALTAASRTLPFGTRLRVCRQERCVVVRVNDRGPYVSGRVLDLSRGASEVLGISGVSRVAATPVASRRVVLPARPKARTTVVRRPARLVVPPARPVATRQAERPALPLPEPTGALGVLAAGLVGTAGAGLTGRRARTDLLVEGDELS